MLRCLSTYLAVLATGVMIASGCAKDEAPASTKNNGDDAGQDAAGDAGIPDADADVGNGDGGDTGADADDDADGGEDVIEGSCIDGDGDGVAGSGDTCDPLAADFDCNDEDEDVFPGAAERCNSLDDDCDGVVDEQVANLCGGCGELTEQPGQVCGDCGRIVCDGPDTTMCDDSGQGSACGGCEELSNVPGQPCGDCGSFICSGINSVSCLDPGRNACGGCGNANVVLGDSCGTCGDGQWACEATSVRCNGSTTRRRYYRDTDEDGFGQDDDFQTLCGPEDNLTAEVGGDCQDSDPAVNPDATEVCTGFDVDCDGLVDEGVDNGCGGCSELPGEVGTTCGGDCGSGTWTCTSANSLTCEGAPGVNACGGCTDLEGEPAEACGDCGKLECDGLDTLVCNDPGFNACGGCELLSPAPGAPCGTCGTLVCDGVDGTMCDDPGANVCGGCMTLAANPGDSCGACGTVVCDGANGTMCDDPGDNGCGGCTPLVPALGTACGSCGALVCNGQESTMCNDPGVNACGGCETLSNQPGEDCGSCGQYECTGPNQVGCNGDNLNACGGCSTLPDLPGDPCGACGTFACDTPDTVVCSSDTPNACGGCSSLMNQPGSGCGDCGSFVCDGMDAVMCADPGFNACGGCDTLEGQPGAMCGDCGTWACDGGNDVDCDDPGFNGCGGCMPLANPPGDPCGSCGMYICADVDQVTCGDPGFNACGGCATLPGNPGEQCDVNPCSQWECFDPDTLVCNIMCPAEVCDNSIDDDMDGLTDCRDPDCQTGGTPCQPDVIILQNENNEDAWISRIRGTTIVESARLNTNEETAFALALDPIDDVVWASIGQRIYAIDITTLNETFDSGLGIVNVGDLATVVSRQRIVIGDDQDAVVFDPISRTVEDTIGLGPPYQVSGISVSPDETEVALAHVQSAGDGWVSFVDTATWSYTDSWSVGDRAQDVVHRGNYVVVFDAEGYDMSVHDRATGSIVWERTEMSGVGSHVNPHNVLVYDPLRNAVWTSVQGFNEVLGVDLDDGTFTTIANISVAFLTKVIMSADNQTLLGIGDDTPRSGNFFDISLPAGPANLSPIDEDNLPTNDPVIDMIRVWRP